MTHPRRPLIVIAAGLAAAALAGCAQTPQTSTHAPLTQKTLSTVVGLAERQAGSVHLHIDTQLKGKSAVTVDADIIYPETATSSPAPSTAKPRTTATPHAAATAADAATPKPNAIDETITVGSKTVKIREVNGTSWVNLGASTGNGFAQLDGAPSSTATTAKTYTSSVLRTDPLAADEQLAAAILLVQRAGADTRIAGVKVTPYLVEVNTTKAADLLLGTDAVSSAVAAALPTQVDEDIWVGTNGLPYRSSTVVGSLDEEITYSKWGKVADITPPSSRTSAEHDAAGSGDGSRS